MGPNNLIQSEKRGRKTRNSTTCSAISLCWISWFRGGGEAWDEKEKTFNFVQELRRVFCYQLSPSSGEGADMWREREVYICARCEPISFMLGFGHYHQGQTTHLYCAPYLDLRSAPPFSRKQRNFHFHFLEREILIGDLWNSTNEFNLSVLTLGRFLNIKQNFDWNDASLETNSHFIIFFATLWKKKSHLNISFQLHFMAFINSHAVPLS